LIEFLHLIDPDDLDVGLLNGELAIPGSLLREQVFDPVIEEVTFATILN